MKYQSIISGLAGSIALTILHETLRKTVDDAPRMDKMGRQGLRKILEASGSKVPPADDLQKITLAGDVIGNAAYYALVGIKPLNPLSTGAALGLAAGIGALVLPGKIGLNDHYSNATTKTQVLTGTLYFTGGLIAGAVYKMLDRKSSGRRLNDQQHYNR